MWLGIVFFAGICVGLTYLLAFKLWVKGFGDDPVCQSVNGAVDISEDVEVYQYSGAFDWPWYRVRAIEP